MGIELVLLFITPFIIAFGIFLLNENKKKIEKPLGLCLIVSGGYYFIDSLIFAIKLISSI